MPTAPETAWASGVAETKLSDVAFTSTRPPFASTRLSPIPARVTPANVFEAIAAAMESAAAPIPPDPPAISATLPLSCITCP